MVDSLQKHHSQTELRGAEVRNISQHLPPLCCPVGLLHVCIKPALSYRNGPAAELPCRSFCQALYTRKSLLSWNSFRHACHTGGLLMCCVAGRIYRCICCNVFVDEHQHDAICRTGLDMAEEVAHQMQGLCVQDAKAFRLQWNAEGVLG